MNNFTIFLLVFIVIGLPVILGIGSSVFKDWIKHKERMATALNAQTAEKSAQYAAHTERLEQRVRVLERIVTDRGIALSTEIEQLRDQRLIHQTTLQETGS
jgi:phage host-nuclease inhibitor protein Gam